MKRFLTVILLIVSATVIISGCSQKSDFTVTEVENVYMRVCDITPTGATIIIKDTNKEPYCYGEWFKIEKEINGEWYGQKPISDEYCFIEIAYVPNKKSEITLPTDWKDLYGELAPGKYRIIKEISTHEYISADFVI